MVEAFAQRAGVTSKEARRLLRAFGAAAQMLILRARLVGIPGLGVVHLQDRTMMVDVGRLAHMARSRAYIDPPPHRSEVRPIRVRRLAIHVPAPLRRLLAESAITPAPLKHQLKQERERFRLIRRRRKNGSIVY
jgi:hypothetical protein